MFICITDLDNVEHWVNVANIVVIHPQKVSKTQPPTGIVEVWLTHHRGCIETRMTVIQLLQMVPNYGGPL